MRAKHLICFILFFLVGIALGAPVFCLTKHEAADSLTPSHAAYYDDLMHPIDQSPLLQMLRGERLSAVAWLVSACLLIAGYAVASHLELWDEYANSGLYVCLDLPARCEAPARDVHIAGEIVTFSLLSVGGISAFIAAGLSFLDRR